MIEELMIGLVVITFEPPPIQSLTIRRVKSKVDMKIRRLTVFSSCPLFG